MKHTPITKFHAKKYCNAYSGSETLIMDHG